MEYITYEEYNEIGGVLDVTAFARYKVRAFSVITKATFGRVKKMLNIPEEVKHLCRDLIEYLNYNVNQSKNITSESQSQGGASESVSYANKTTADTTEDIEQMIYDYLASVMDDEGTPLIYRGC